MSSRRRSRVLYALAAAAAVAVAGMLVPAGPQGTYAVKPMPVHVHFDNGDERRTEFHALLVYDGRPTALTSAVASAWSELRVNPLLARSASLFDRSTDAARHASLLAAWTAAGRILGSPSMPGAMLLGSGVPGPFRSGDVVIAVDGQRVPTTSWAATITAGPADVVVLRDGARRMIRTSGPVHVEDPGTRWMLTGALEPPVTVPGLEGVHGPSAGLVLALAFVDAQTPGDLTGGRSVAATGAVFPHPDGTDDVGPVSAVRQKVAAAVSSGIDVVLVPRASAADAADAAAGSSTTVVPVSTVRDAVAYLCREGADDDVCETFQPAGSADVRQ